MEQNRQINDKIRGCLMAGAAGDALELSEIILAVADDLTTSCIIDEWVPIDTPERRQWYLRYCEMLPEGISTISQR